MHFSLTLNGYDQVVFLFFILICVSLDMFPVRWQRRHLNSSSDRLPNLELSYNFFVAPSLELLKGGREESTS